MARDDFRESISVEYIATSNMVKYDRMGKLIPYAFTGSDADHITLFIDLFPIYRNTISRKYRTSMNEYIALVPAIVNMCVHYRQFFKKLGVATKIYLISSYNVSPICCKLVYGYNKPMQEKLTVTEIVEMVRFNNELLDILCPYLPNIYFIPTEFESAVVIDYLIQREKDNGNQYPYLIISRDTLPAQLLSRYNDVAFLKPYKINGEDLSQIIPPSSHMDFERRFNDTVYGLNAENASQHKWGYVSPCNYVPLLALNGFKSRSMLSLMNINIASKLINEASPNIPIDMDMLFALNPELKEKISKEIAGNRFVALFSRGLMMSQFLSSGEPENFNYLDLIDPGALAMINSKYFPNDPISIYQL